jgi:hypothetical protein
MLAASAAANRTQTDFRVDSIDVIEIFTVPKAHLQV